MTEASASVCLMLATACVEFWILWLVWIPRCFTFCQVFKYLRRAVDLGKPVLDSGARFSKVSVTFRARNQIFKSKYKELERGSWLASDWPIPVFISAKLTISLLWFLIKRTHCTSRMTLLCRITVCCSSFAKIHFKRFPELFSHGFFKLSTQSSSLCLLS